jgi:homogentisate 1,2-dioxygenase
MGAGEPTLKQGISIYAYSANASMGKTAFYNSDGDFLIVPHKGTMFVRTLNGRLVVKPKEILIIPRGIKFSIDVEGEIKGWVAEVFGHHFSLPELGPIGANGMANPGDFESPTAWYEDKKEEWTVHIKLPRFTTNTLDKFGSASVSSVLTTWWAGRATTLLSSIISIFTTPSAPSRSTIPIRQSSQFSPASPPWRGT